MAAAPLTLGPACTAYSRYVLDVGQSEDWISLQVALAPCLLGYGAIATQLLGNPTTKKDGNTYWPWILNYVADDYVQAVKTGSGKDEPHRIIASGAVEEDKTMHTQRPG